MTSSISYTSNNSLAALMVSPSTVSYDSVVLPTNHDPVRSAWIAVRSPIESPWCPIQIDDDNVHVCKRLKLSQALKFNTKKRKKGTEEIEENRKGQKTKTHWEKKTYRLWRLWFFLMFTPAAMSRVYVFVYSCPFILDWLWVFGNAG